MMDPEDVHTSLLELEARIHALKRDAKSATRLQLAAGFLGEAAGLLEDEAFRVEAKRALRWADLLIEESER